MEWITTLFIEHTAIQAVLLISSIAALGLALSKIRLFGISLGITFIFFVGILFGELGFSINPQMLDYAESFGLVIFVYALGLQVGAGFFSSFRNGGIKLNLLALSVLILGTGLALAMSYMTPVSLPDIVGVLCGASTNTPALAAAQQTLSQMGIDDSTAALGCAVSYPLGVVGVIFAMIIIQQFFKIGNQETSVKKVDKEHATTIISYQIHNPAIFGMEIGKAAQLSKAKFVISRIWRNGKVLIPNSITHLLENDRILLATLQSNTETLKLLFGEQEQRNWDSDDTDWNAIDNELLSQRIVVTNPKLNGKQLGQLGIRKLYGINITRIDRSDVELLATPDLILQMGDRVTIVGNKEAVKQVAQVLGNHVKNLNEPNLITVFIGLVLGLALGAVPISISSMATPIKLGLAGGPIIVGILIGTFGPRLHMITYVTKSANLMLQRIGLALYLACLGLSSGAHFLESIIQGQGVLWILLGFILTILPVLIVGMISMKIFKLDFGTTSGMLCGAMANPMALKYADDVATDDTPSIAYATVYPLSMFLRVISAQLILMLFL